MLKLNEQTKEFEYRIFVTTDISKKFERFLHDLDKVLTINNSEIFFVKLTLAELADVIDWLLVYDKDNNSYIYDMKTHKTIYDAQADINMLSESKQLKENYPINFFKHSSHKFIADSESLVTIENENLTLKGLIAKAYEWDEQYHGVELYIYNLLKKDIEKLGGKMPKDIRKLYESKQLKENDDLLTDEKEMDYKELINTIGDLYFYVVDGDNIRNTITSEFTAGGNWLRWDFIPEGEIWVEKVQSEDNKVKTLVHEFVEVLVWMLEECDYDEAHSVAVQFEDMIRGNLQDPSYMESDVDLSENMQIVHELLQETKKLKENKISVKDNEYDIKYVDFSNYKSYSHGIYLYFKDNSWIELYFQEPDYVVGYNISPKQSKYTQNIVDQLDKNPKNNILELTVDDLQEWAGIKESKNLKEAYDDWGRKYTILFGKVQDYTSNFELDKYYIDLEKIDIKTILNKLKSYKNILVAEYDSFYDIECFDEDYDAIYVILKKYYFSKIKESKKLKEDYDSEIYDNIANMVLNNDKLSDQARDKGYDIINDAGDLYEFIDNNYNELYKMLKKSKKESKNLREYDSGKFDKLKRKIIKDISTDKSEVNFTFDDNTTLNVNLGDDFTLSDNKSGRNIDLFKNINKVSFLKDEKVKDIFVDSIGITLVTDTYQLDMYGGSKPVLNESKQVEYLPYKQAEKNPKEGIKYATYDNMQAWGAESLGRKFGITAEAMYKWVMDHGIDITKNGYILAKISANDMVYMVINDMVDPEIVGPKLVYTESKQLKEYKSDNPIKEWMDENMNDVTILRLLKNGGFDKNNVLTLTNIKKFRKLYDAGKFDEIKYWFNYYDKGIVESKQLKEDNYKQEYYVVFDKNTKYKGDNLDNYFTVVEAKDTIEVENIIKKNFDTNKCTIYTAKTFLNVFLKRNSNVQEIDLETKEIVESKKIKENEVKLSIGDKIKDSEGNVFRVNDITKDPIIVKNERGEKIIFVDDLKFYKKI